jgi:hypothetical protein
LGTDPFNADTDGDGNSDGEDPNLVLVAEKDADAGMVILSSSKASKTPSASGKAGKGLSTEPTILGYVSADQTSACAIAAAADFISGNYAAFSLLRESPKFKMWRNCWISHKSKWGYSSQ